MSKARKSDAKDNTISSKLLGTNIQDINIEKFRDITALNKTKYQLNGKLTVPILKSVTNKFAPQIMFTITLPDQGITSLDPLEQCENLVVLNVSDNKISLLTPLAKLKQIKFLNVANNQISNLDVLRNLTKLVNLRLEGNFIKSRDALAPLNSCEELRNMYLQTVSGNCQNPLCNQNGYRSGVLESVKAIKRLDGISRSVELNNGLDLVKKNKKELKIQLKNNGPFYAAKFPSIMATYGTINGEDQLKKSISDCKSSISSLQIRLKAALAAK